MWSCCFSFGAVGGLIEPVGGDFAGAPTRLPKRAYTKDRGPSPIVCILAALQKKRFLFALVLYLK
jgi:hypothetical protein